MKKNSFIEQSNSEAVFTVRVGNISVAKFADLSSALSWAFSMGFRVYYKNNDTSLPDTTYCWIKYSPERKVTNKH